MKVLEEAVELEREVVKTAEDVVRVDEAVVVATAVELTAEEELLSDVVLSVLVAELVVGAVELCELAMEELLVVLLMRELEEEVDELAAD